MSWDPLDIEDLHRIAQRQQLCPYYASRDRASVADLIFMPYNYLIEEKIRENYEIGYNNSIIIFDEAHNVAPVSEEVSSFELKAKVLEATLTELHDLKETHSDAGDRQLKSEPDEIAYIKSMTQRFLKYVRKLSLHASDHPNAIPGASENRYLPDRSIVLPGDEIFNIFFTGTEGDDINSEGEYIKQNLAQDWNAIQVYFDNALNDVSNITQGNVRTQMETWYDVLKKVMRIWTNKAQSMKSKPTAGKKIEGGTDSEGFYVFLYDEEDKNNQA